MGALNVAAKLINGLLASAESDGKSGSTTSSKSQQPAAAAQQLAAGAAATADSLAGQANQAAAQAAGAVQGSAVGVGEGVEKVFGDLQGELCLAASESPSFPEGWILQNFSVHQVSRTCGKRVALTLLYS